MKRGTLLLIGLLVVGGALVVYPITSPVPNPEERLRLVVESPTDDDNYSPVVEYQQLPADAQALFDQARRNRTAIQPVGQSPDRWVEQANRSQQGIGRNFVLRNDRYYGVILALNDSAGRLRLTVRPLSKNRSYPLVTEYQQLSTDARAVLDEAIKNGTATQPIKQAPDRWVTQTNEDQSVRVQQNYIIRNGTYYPVFPTRISPTPPLPAIALRLGSLGVGICLILYVGYRSILN